MTGEYLHDIDTAITYRDDLPLCVRAFLLRTPEGTCIVVNARLTDEAQKKAVLHELEHLRRGDLDSSLSVALIERRLEE